MRLSKVEDILSTLKPKERLWIKELAHARAHFTGQDYARFHEFSRQRAHVRLRKEPYCAIFKAFSPSIAQKCPDIFFLRNPFAYPFNSTYKEPKNGHSLLDGLLRYQLLIPELSDGNWSHHVFQPAVLATSTGVHVADCLDRAAATVFKFALDVDSQNLPVTLHIASSRRYNQIHTLMETRSMDRAAEIEDEVTWDNLLSNRNRQVQSRSKGKTTFNIHVRFHELSPFRFKEAC